MKNIQLIGVILVVIGSFLPLLKIPLVGNWNYWKIDPYLVSIIWILCALALFFIQKQKLKATRIVSGSLIFLFVFTIIAIKLKSLDFFSFLPFKSWQSAFAGIVNLSWGWFFEFAGAALMLFGINKNQNLNN
ncbi:hypothetical protein G6R40_03025 [Chryseobacterium sp. POL2]|uniref:hypothetical protein n=1 Tax=Chryseobacterium sp. POL2 TaxID=2713414 RepID=UPI0013E14058|nr:hypothetical protein [Chryseobacterium sp. POL2]QIG88704.1 hypothetical protein G6R40_03025 [Chryseobacterium sp. POL2]